MVTEVLAGDPALDTPSPFAKGQAGELSGQGSSWKGSGAAGTVPSEHSLMGSYGPVSTELWRGAPRAEHQSQTWGVPATSLSAHGKFTDLFGPCLDRASSIERPSSKSQDTYRSSLGEKKKIKNT